MDEIEVFITVRITEMILNANNEAVVKQFFADDLPNAVHAFPCLRFADTVFAGNQVNAARAVQICQIHGISEPFNTLIHIRYVKIHTYHSADAAANGAEAAIQFREKRKRQFKGDILRIILELKIKSIITHFDKARSHVQNLCLSIGGNITAKIRRIHPFLSHSFCTFR